MFDHIRKWVGDWLHGAHPVLLLSIPFLLCGLIIIFLISTLPTEGTLRYFFLASIFAITLLSRMLQTFEWGVEVYHLTTFCFTFVYGPIAGILFTLAGSILVVYAAIFIGGHMFNHSVPGPLIQCLEVFVMTLLAGLASVFLHDFVLDHLVYFALAFYIPCMVVDKFLLNRIVGIDWWRNSNAFMIGLLLNYNLFSTFGLKLIGLMEQFA